MKQPDAQVIKGLDHIAQNVPAVTDWIIENADLELQRLPAAVNNFAVQQGRCQVLQELKKAFEEAPDHAAQSRQGQQHV